MIWKEYRSNAGMFSFDIATRLRAGRQRNQGSVPSKSRRFFSSSQSHIGLGPTHLPLQFVPWTLSLVLKRKEREADHTPQSNAKIKLGEIIFSHPPPPICFHRVLFK
jgi:hypothetical protein